MTWVMPFPESTITGEYGTMSAFRKKNKMQAHSGTDWAPPGSNKGKTPIHAIASGTIKLIQWSNVLGWVIVQSAADAEGKIWYIGYCHLAAVNGDVNCKKGKDSQLATTLKVGDKVKAGESVIGFCGNSGSASSGTHLHATLGKTIKAVFGMTSEKYDLKKAIKANGGGVAPTVTKKDAKAINKAVSTGKPVAQHATPAAPTPEPKVSEVKPLVADTSKELTVDDWKKLQEILKRDHGYAGAIDGEPGALTYKALQRSVVAFGYSGPVDGEPGGNTYKAVQRRLVAKGVYEGRVDGSWGPQTIAALREAIRTNKY